MNRFSYDDNELLFDFEEDIATGPVTCLGKTFASDKERKDYYLDLLREKLKDPDFRNQEGFPIGTDDDILALSDPPYYCACPNPWMNDFIDFWESEKKEKPSDWIYKREPFASDVTEGKNDPIYNAHSYHTKVPHKAIMRYILHYTEPGDIVFDGFCGSGMTGVAAQMCGNENEFNQIVNADLIEGGAKYQFGKRNAILGDLAPSATYLSYNYNRKHNSNLFEKDYKKIVSEILSKYGYLYETKVQDGQTATINYTVWSDVMICPNCGKELVLYDCFYKMNSKGEMVYTPEFSCPCCGAMLSKSLKKGTTQLIPSYISKYDCHHDRTKQIVKRIPVLINCSLGSKRIEKKPDSDDLLKIKEAEKLIKQISCYPYDILPDGFNTRQPKKSHNIDSIDEFYEARTLLLLSEFSQKLTSDDMNFLFGSILPKMTKLNRYMPQHGSRALVGPMAGTLYIPPVSVENNVFDQLEFQRKKIIKAFVGNNDSVISTQAIQMDNLKANSVDYIFLDPPFGANLMYSEINFLREGWLKVFTNNKEEAIENEVQDKSINEYQSLMLESFKKAYRILKAGHWMTVEFSNTKASVWNAIQNAICNAGFIIASVAVLDKKRGGIHAMLGAVAVKQDLVISAYKPDELFEQQIVESNEKDKVWVFVRKHLDLLPVVKKNYDGNYEVISERDPRLIFDQLVAYYVSHNMLLPISSPEFLQDICKHFIVRDGLVYLPEQVTIYDKLKSMNKLGDGDYTIDLFVHDEVSAINWIRESLKKKTMTLGELTPLFLQEVISWDKNQTRLELVKLLEENFLCYDGEDEVPAAIHGYLSTNYKNLRNLSKLDPQLKANAKGRWYVPDPNKQADLDKVREKNLIKEFNNYNETKGKIKEFRIEAVRAGFKKAWQDKEYKKIVLFAERLPSQIIEEDSKLFMWYSGALTKVE